MRASRSIQQLHLSLHVAVLLASAVLGLPARSKAQAAPSISLAEARETALVRSPRLRAARAAVAAARAELRTAGTFPFNPVLEGALGRKRPASVDITFSRNRASSLHRISRGSGKVCFRCPRVGNRIKLFVVAHTNAAEGCAVTGEAPP